MDAILGAFFGAIFGVIFGAIFFLLNWAPVFRCFDGGGGSVALNTKKAERFQQSSTLSRVPRGPEPVIFLLLLRRRT